MDTAFFISILVFTGVMLLGSGMFYYAGHRKKQRRLMDKIKGEAGEFNLEETLNASFKDSVSGNFLKRYFLNVIDSMGNLLKPKSELALSNIRKNLLRAGYLKRNAIVIFYGIKTLLAIIMSACFFLLKILVIKAMSPFNFMTYSILSALLGFYLPNLWIQIVIRKRKRKILEGFPDALDLMVVCVESGMGLDSALLRAGKEMEIRNKLISEEFKILNLELRAGKSRRDALRNLATRIDLEDVKNLVSLLIQTDRFGTSIAKALRVYSDSMRSKRFQRADELANKLPVKLVFPLILFIFPSLFVTLLGPAMIKIYRSLFPLLVKG